MSGDPPDAGRAVSDIADKLRAVLKMRAQLDADVSKLDAKIATQERAIKRLRTEREAAVERLTSIEDALRPLADLADGVVAKAKAPPTVIEGGRRKIDVILEAIGKRGLDDWSVPEIAAAAGLPGSAVWPYIKTLCDANRIHKTDRGRYRTSQARVA